MTEQIQFSPTTPPRGNAVYVSWELSQMLKYAAKKEGGTREDLFEREMLAYLIAKHRDVVDWVDARAKAEKEFVKGLEKKDCTA